MDIRNIKIGNQLYEVITQQQFSMAPNIYDRDFTAILFDGYVDMYGNVVPSFVLPFRNINELASNNPGIYGISSENNSGSVQPCFNIVYPFHYEMNNIRVDRAEYLASNMLDSTNLTQMQELIDLDAKYKEFEFDIVTAGMGDETVFRILPTDAPEMIATKQALNAKHVDIDKYKARIGSTFANDKRFLQNSPSITFNKVKALFPALDLKCSITIDNTSPDVPNPIPHPITVNITGDVDYSWINNSVEESDTEECEDV